MTRTTLKIIGLTLSCVLWAVCLLSPVPHQFNLKCKPWKFGNVNHI